jgi:FkbM family methyltransferase
LSGFNILRLFGLSAGVGDERRRLARWRRGAREYAYLGDGIGVTRTHRDHRIFVYTRDLGIAPHLIMSGTWEWAIEHAVRRLLSPGDTVIEAGCNMGYHSLAMADRIGETGRFFGFEANPELFTLLQWTMNHNHFTGRSTLYNHAVTETAGQVEFAYDRDGIGGGHVVSGPHVQREVISIAAYPLDETLADLSNVAMLRMDVEGFEPMVIRGARGIIERSPDIVIVAEWSVYMMGARVDLPAFVDELAAQGFRAWRIDPTARFQPVAMPELLDLPHCDVAFARSRFERFD